MSAAPDLVPVIHVPAPARRADSRCATVVTLHAPSVRSVAPPLRLTRRGVGAVAAAVVLASAALVLLAWLSAPGSSLPAPTPPASVTVRSGDTLWSIATRLAPDGDPRAEVAKLQRLNHLAGAQLSAGDVLRTR